MNNLAPDGLVLPQRTIPWPTSVSQAARDRLVQMHRDAAAADITMPDPTDKEAWRAYVAMVDAVLLERPGFYAVAERPGITSETTTIGGVQVHISTPDALPADARHCIYLDIHGGGMVLLAGEGARRGGLREAARIGARTISVDYRVPPDHPYPAALDDCVAVYRALLADNAPGSIIAGGISGGGNLAAAMVLRARDEGLALPAALVLLTPEIDLTESGDSFDTLLGLDPVLGGRLATQIAAYAPGADLTHPYLSPLFGDFTRGYPPSFLQSGTRDLFLSNTVRMHRALREANIPAELHVWEAMPHGGFMDGAEDEQVSREIRKFTDAHWGSA
jgi:monoterpene epsilon-lactone hydrolase